MVHDDLTETDMATPKIAVSIRLSPVEHEALRRQADTERRSLSSLAEKLVADGLLVQIRAILQEPEEVGQ
jgi:hypothetical protein